MTDQLERTGMGAPAGCVANTVVEARPVRRYEPNPKHKHGPQQHGSECPEQITTEEAQRMLDDAIADPADEPRCYWYLKGAWVFKAYATRIEEGVWHGFPVLGSEVRAPVLKAFLERGWIDRAQRRALVEQRERPTTWPGQLP